ncbi:class I SAM-dependent methyltransferase [candidate division TA06 bacterium]|nr:class I SAM-dependent methyltransferase [candidate division TA06 bacterium]
MTGRPLPENKYWNQVADSVEGYYLLPVLARYKTGEYRNLLSRWGLGKKGRILYTDLYEAALGDPGLFVYPDSISEVFGMDISSGICRKSQARLTEAGKNVRIICSDARFLACQDETFDLIVSPSTFDHFPEIEKAINECYRVLKPGGRLVLALNSGSNPFFKLGVRLAERFKKKEYQTGYFYRAGQVRSLLTNAGFANGRQTGVMHVPVGAVTIMEWLAKHNAPASLARTFISLFSLLGRLPHPWPLFTGWWIATEGVKPGRPA